MITIYPARKHYLVIKSFLVIKAREVTKKWTGVMACDVLPVAMFFWYVLMPNLKVIRIIGWMLKMRPQRTPQGRASRPCFCPSAWRFCPFSFLALTRLLASWAQNQPRRCCSSFAVCTTCGDVCAYVVGVKHDKGLSKILGYHQIIIEYLVLREALQNYKKWPKVIPNEPRWHTS